MVGDFASQHRKDVAEQFAKDTQEHEFRELHRRGLYGHWKARKAGTGFSWFDIVTWPGVLMINSDQGAYAFSRVENMIGFMSCEQGDGAADYMAEKCIAVDRNSTMRKFAIEIAIEHAREAYAEAEASGQSKSSREDAEYLLQSLEEISSLEEHDAMQAMFDSCLWDELPQCSTFSHSYLWCLHAIRKFCAWHAETYKESDKT